MATKSYICKQCQYKGNTTTEKGLPRKCPYCGQSDVEFVKSAQDLLHEVSTARSFRD